MGTAVPRPHSGERGRGGDTLAPGARARGVGGRPGPRAPGGARGGQASPGGEERARRGASGDAPRPAPVPLRPWTRPRQGRDSPPPASRASRRRAPTAGRTSSRSSSPRRPAVYSAVDDVKPKSTTRLERLREHRGNPAVALLADHYEDDWTALWWARADGVARLLDPGDPEAAHARRLLAARYPQYRDAPPPGTVIAVDVTRWSGWAGAAA